MGMYGVPARSFIATMPRRITLASIIDAKQQWGVSALAYVYRLWSLGRLSKYQYHSLCIQIKSTYGATEPGPMRDRETSQVLTKVITPNPAAVRKEIVRHLNIPLRNLNEITFGLALTPVAGSIQPKEKPKPNAMPETKPRLRLVER